MTNWNENKSVVLSKVCVGAFALLLLALDVTAFWLIPMMFELLSRFQVTGLILVTYLCSVPAWAALWCLWKLLGNLGKGLVFVAENVRWMRLVSWACFGVAFLCAVVGCWFVHLVIILVLAGAAAFMGLIVRIVKNAFEQAISMKDELDFTI